MTITVIVELKAKPGARDELRRVFERMLAEHGSGVRGYLGSSRYEVLARAEADGAPFVAFEDYRAFVTEALDELGTSTT